MDIHTPVRSNRYISLFDVPEKISVITKTVRQEQNLNNHQVQFLVQLLHSDQCRLALRPLKEANDKVFEFVTAQIDALNSSFKEKEVDWLLSRMVKTKALRWQLAIKLMEHAPEQKTQKVAEGIYTAAMTGLLLPRSRREIVKSLIALMSHQQTAPVAKALQTVFEHTPELCNYIFEGLLSFPLHNKNREFHRVCCAAFCASGTPPAPSLLQELNKKLAQGPQRLKTLTGSSQHQALSRVDFQSRHALSDVVQMSEQKLQALMQH